MIADDDRTYPRPIGSMTPDDDYDGTRCPWAVLYGIDLATRCKYLKGHTSDHQGRGLTHADDEPRWLAGDSREFRTQRKDAFAWEGEYPCVVGLGTEETQP